MTNCVVCMSPRKAAVVFGVAIIVMFILAIFVGNFILPNFIGPGDTATLARDMAADQARFGFAVAGYLLILMLDIVIALAVYIILRPVSKILASVTALLRLLYVAILVVAVFVLVFQFIDVYGYATVKLIGYTFFTLHILFLGYTALKSSYIPKSLGILLVIAFFSYIILIYGKSLVPQVLLPIFVVPAAIAELLLGIWFLWKREKIPVIKSSGD
jgi:hypothetical protein